MKKIALYLMAAMAFCACSKQSLTALQQTAQADPIQPVHLIGDTTRIFLTDYFPGLTDYQWDSVKVCGLDYRHSLSTKSAIASEYRFCPICRTPTDCIL